MYEHDHPAYRKLQEIGHEITNKVKPRAVVVFSAHWQASRDTVQVNNAEITELIYEYVHSLFPFANPLTSSCGFIGRNQANISLARWRGKEDVEEQEIWTPYVLG